MSRIRLILGWVVISIAYYFWWYMNQVEVVTSFGRVIDTTNGSSLTIDHYVVMMASWYALSWVNIVNQWHRRPVLRFGRYVRTLEPGISLVEPLIHTTLNNVSIQDIVVEIEVKNLQTKDNVGVALTGVLTYRIDESKVKDSVINVEDVDDSVQERALSTLTDVGATQELDHLLENRINFCEQIQNKLIERVARWGVVVEAFELKEFGIKDTTIEQAIAMKARAVKEGSAELARAQMQEQIATALNKAAATYDEKGRWLKGIEVLIELCRSGNNNTVLIPTDLTEALARVKSLLG